MTKTFWRRVTLMTYVKVKIVGEWSPLVDLSFNWIANNVKLYFNMQNFRIFKEILRSNLLTIDIKREFVTDARLFGGAE